MITNIAIWLGLLGLAALFIWLAGRALRVRNPAARWSLALLAALPALLFGTAAAGVANGYVQLYRPRAAATLALDTASTPARIERGAHLARTTCVACHSLNGELPLSGGIDLSTHSPLPIGTIVPPNLTPGGPLRDWSDADIAQAIRNGRHRDGRTLLMPTGSLRNLSDEDVASLVAFLRSQPAVEHQTPPLSPSPLLAFVFGAGIEPLATPPVSGAVDAPAHEPTLAYGRYVASYQDCASCHGSDLNGSTGGLAPPAPSARAFARAWTEEQFIQTMRTGVDPGGHVIQEPMPWQMIGQMDDVELGALYRYLRGSE